MSPPPPTHRPLDAVYVTAPSCRLCDHGREVLADLQQRVPLQVREVDLLGDEGRDLVAAARVAFPPALFVDGRLVAHGRLSLRALERTFGALAEVPPATDRQG